MIISGSKDMFYNVTTHFYFQNMLFIERSIHQWILKKTQILISIIIDHQISIIEWLKDTA